jgi:hypothetical protein
VSMRRRGRAEQDPTLWSVEMWRDAFELNVSLTDIRPPQYQYKHEKLVEQEITLLTVTTYHQYMVGQWNTVRALLYYSGSKIFESAILFTL